MRKTVFAIAAACAAACCFGACNSSCNDDKPSFNQYDELNSMINKSYSKIELTVTDTFDGDTSLVSEYTMQYSEGGVTVSYSVERFSSLSLGGDDWLITVYTGEAVIKDGSVVSVTGDDIGITADITKTGFTFKQEYFANVNESILGIRLEADVVNPGGFTGTDMTCTDMKVKADYFDAFTEMQIAYTAENGGKVEYAYVFTV